LHLLATGAVAPGMSTLFHVSDLHFGREDPGALAWFARAVRDERPDAVIITGDLTMRARAHEFAAASAWLKALEVPVSIEVGNHDLPYFNLLKRMFRPYARFERIERALERPLALADADIIPLRTTARAQWRTNWSHGVVTKRRLAVTVGALTTRQTERVAIVTCHHPLIDREGGQAEGRTRGGRAALSALAEAGADLILSGHVHDPFDISWTGGARSVRMIGAGTLSERVRESPPSFNEITIDGSAVEVVPRTM